LSRTFLDAICGLVLVLASQDSTCFNVTECFIVDSRTSMSRSGRADLLHHGLREGALLTAASQSDSASTSTPWRIPLVPEKLTLQARVGTSHYEC
jgi:hypothetical protein